MDKSQSNDSIQYYEAIKVTPQSPDTEVFDIRKEHNPDNVEINIKNYPDDDSSRNKYESREN